MGNAQRVHGAQHLCSSIPDWAQSGMHDDVHQYVYQQIYSQNIGPLTQELRTAVAGLGLWRAVRGNPSQGRRERRGRARGATGPATGTGVCESERRARPPEWIAQQAANRIAGEVADEWIARPWPYEITPPPQPVPPTCGLTDDDRQHYFTFLAGARTNDQSSPRPVLTQLFPADSKPMVAFAQGENFNWMEFNGNYGAGDSYDRYLPFRPRRHGRLPRPWRLSTTGGWNWQPRLALSDALYQAIQDGSEFRDFSTRAASAAMTKTPLKRSLSIDVFVASVGRLLHGTADIELILSAVVMITIMMLALGAMHLAIGRLTPHTATFEAFSNATTGKHRSTPATWISPSTASARSGRACPIARTCPSRDPGLRLRREQTTSPPPPWVPRPASPARHGSSPPTPSRGRMRQTPSGGFFSTPQSPTPS